jgi:hypothetical protein
MLIINGVDVTNPVHKPVTVSGSNSDQEKDAKPESTAEKKPSKPVNLVDCGLLYFPNSE